MKSLLLSKLMTAVLSASVLFQQPSDKATIRVLLMTDGYGGYFHDDIEYQILEDKQGFQLLSVNRENGHPIYKGNLDIIKTEKGILLVNEVLIEEYLKSVVPSEMPSNYELEALKAQAICARTYAYKQMLSGELEDYYADVDDSVNYQVYNNQERSVMSDLAVSMTKGMVMTYEGEPIHAYFFSTSSGATSTDEVWNGNGLPYLKSIVTEYDEKMPWYRWRVHFPCFKMDELLEAKGYEIGHVKKIEVLERSQGGAVTGCRFVGETDSIEFCDEYTIRNILSPNGLEVHRQDGTIVNDFSILPSAYFEVSPVYQEEQLVGFDFSGGGYGHGVGMSQNGANEMAKQGATYLDILNYYYKDFQLDILNE